MIFIGIDPGKSGAISVLSAEKNKVNILETSMFSRDAYIALLDKYKECSLVALEQVHSMPSQGVRSMFNFGENF